MKAHFFPLHKIKISSAATKNVLTDFLTKLISDFGGTAPKHGITNKGDEKKLKYILYWNKAYGSDDYGFCCGQVSSFSNSLR
jgi:hypothetical protein